MAEEKKPQPKKPLGRPKKGPLEMAEFFYSRKGINVWIFASSLLLVGSCILMILDDYSREWKEYQLAFRRIQLRRAEIEIEEIDKQLKEQRGRLRELEDRLRKARARADKDKSAVDGAILRALTEENRELRALQKTQEPEIQALIEAILRSTDPVLRGLQSKDGRPVQKSVAGFEKDLEALAAPHSIAKQEMNFADADEKVAVYELRVASHRYEQARKEQQGNLSELQEQHEQAKRKHEAITTRLVFSRRLFQYVDKMRNAILQARDALQKDVKEVEKELKALLKEKEAAERKRDSLRITTTTRIRNLPGLDFFGPPVKIQQVVLNEKPILEELNFTQVPRVDRCQTCHVGIENPHYAAVRDSDGTYRFVDPVSQRIIEEEFPNEDERQKMIKLFMAHPHLELFVGGQSPHNLKTFGCTVCHGGDGRQTDFSLVAHTPDDPEERAAWVRRNDYHPRHLWDHPMIPTRYIESSCRKCHVQEWELDGAPKYTKGMILFERAGCYACHKTDTYPVLKKHLQKPGGGRLDETKRMRRPGPPLTHIWEKLDKSWVFNWIYFPRAFRPTTKMPHFFQQSNARSLEIEKDGRTTVYPPREVEPVIVAAITEFLFSKALKASHPDSPDRRPWAWEPPPRPPRPPDPKRGEAIVKQVGCIACHRLDERYPNGLKGVNAYLDEFAPNLGNVGNKLNRRWLTHWLRNPRRYMPDTRMPSLRLDDQEIADVVEYLMTLKADNADRKVRGLRPWEPTDPPLRLKQEITTPPSRWRLVANPRVREILNGLVREQLRSRLTRIDAERKFEQMSEAERVLYLGEKSVANYGCYSCHDIEGMLELEGIGTELTGTQPWGSKFIDRLDFGNTKWDGTPEHPEGVHHHGTYGKHSFTNEPYVHRFSGEQHVKIEETREAFLKNKLMDPRIYDLGLKDTKPPADLLRMPNFYFSEEEVELLTTFVLSFTNDRVRGLVEGAQHRLDTREQWLNRGKRLIRNYNCAACHRFSLERFLVEWKHELREGSGSKEVTDHVWIEGKLQSRFTEEEAAEYLTNWGYLRGGEPVGNRALFTYVWASDPKQLKPSGLLDVQGDQGYIYFDGARWWFVDAEYMQAYGKHPVLRRKPPWGGDVLPEIERIKREMHGIKDPQQLEARFPPMLRSQGTKTQVDWLINFLKHPHVIRPNLQPLYPGARAMPDINIRMPTFHLTDEEASSLARFFWARDTLPGKEIYPLTPTPMREEEYLQRTYLSTAQGRARLDRIIRFIRKNCAECHVINGKLPSGSAENAYKFAPELGEVQHRLRPRWLDPWLDHPGWIYPGTTMTEMFKGKPEDRKTAVDILMNWSRFMQEKPD